MGISSGFISVLIACNNLIADCSNILRWVYLNQSLDFLRNIVVEPEIQ